MVGELEKEGCGVGVLEEAKAAEETDEEAAQALAEEEGKIEEV